MQLATRSKMAQRRTLANSYDESVDDAAKLVEGDVAIKRTAQ